MKIQIDEKACWQNKKFTKQQVDKMTCDHADLLTSKIICLNRIFQQKFDGTQTKLDSGPILRWEVFDDLNKLAMTGTRRTNQGCLIEGEGSVHLTSLY